MNYLEIEDPLERLGLLSDRIHACQQEIYQLSKLRNASVIEAYEAKHHPKVISEVGGFNVSRFRQIIRNANYTPTHDFRENSKATQFKKEY